MKSLFVILSGRGQRKPHSFLAYQKYGELAQK